MTRGTLSIAALCTLPMIALAAPQQTRDASPSGRVTAGTARIAGRVVTTESTPQPVRRVIVTVTGAELPGGRTAITDAEGRFDFERLPAGRFMLSGTRRAYLPAAYGASRPGRAGVPLQVAEGQQHTDVVLAMPRGAVITGLLRDADGGPAAGIDVAALRIPLPGAGPMLVMTRSATTDDRGVYRLYGLMPGDYLVSSMIRFGARASDVVALSTSQVDAAFAELQRPRGAPSLPSGAASPARAGSYAYTPVFYPGTASADHATAVTIGIGEERGGIDFIVRLMRMSTIEGVLIDGGIPAAPLIINPLGLQMPSLSGSAPTYSSKATPTGRSFTYTNVIPGRYTITAQSSASGVAWARTEVEVQGDDLSGITLLLQPALRLTGRLAFDGSTLAPPPDPRAVELRVLPVNGVGTASVGYTRLGSAVIPPARVERDGRFEVSGLLPDVYRLAATVPGPVGWWLRSAIVNGVDVLDHRLQVGASGDMTGAVLTFSDRHTSLSGTIVSAAGQPAPAYFIAVFPADRAMWGPQARRIQSARTATDGTWIVRGLPPGDYLVAALSDLAPEDLIDPSFLASLAPEAVRLTLAEGEQKTQHFRIGTGGN
jgi:hypothetical protein